MKRFRLALVAFLSIVVLAAVALTITILLREHRTFSAPYPDLRATTDRATIDRGRYLVFGPAHCVNCHSPRDQTPAEGVPLSGGREFDLPLGLVRAPNLTPDVDTGVGGLRDEELARALRYGVGHDGRALLPFMAAADLSDADIVALLSYLRAQPPVHNAVKPTELSLVGRALKALVFEPVGPSGPVLREVPAGATVEYGRYLATSVANCRGCHTNRSMVTGKFLGAPFAGGFRLGDQVSKNLTPDPETGWIYRWSEDDFVARFHRGPGVPGSHMPWAAFTHMKDDDLRAIYRFLRSLPPVRTASS